MTRVKNMVGLVMAFPCFLIVTIIPWELALGAKLLSDWLYDARSPALGAFFRIAAIVIASLLVVATLVAFITWLVALARAALGRESVDKHTA